MGLLDKIESVLPGHSKTEDHTTHTESATGEHTTSQHPHLGHSLHGLTGSHEHEHTTTPATTTVHKKEHTAVPATATTGSTTTHDSKTVAPVSAEHVTTTPATTVPASGSTTSQTVSGSSSHTAGTKVDGPSDTTHHTSETLPPLAGSVLTGHPARYHDLHDAGSVQHGVSKHDHDSGVLGHGHQHSNSTSSDNHKSEHGVTGLINKVTGHSNDHKSESHLSEHATGPHVTEHTTTTTAPAATAAQVPLADVKKHEAVNFIPNAENPSAIPTAGGRVIGAGQIDHNATGTIGKDYPGDKPSTTGLVTSDHATAPAAKDTALPDRTAPAASPVPAAHT